MDYEKAYKAVLKTATQWIKDGCTDKEKICLECVFPELRESRSEDERIRKEAISIVQSYMNICDEEGDPCLSGYKVLTWLEKQKEQKPVEWKPTEEQMEALRIASTASPTDSYILSQLYEQLKKLT